MSRSDKRTQTSLVTPMRVASPSEVVKPARTVKKRVEATVRLSGVKGDGACRKTRSGTERPRVPVEDSTASAGKT